MERIQIWLWHLQLHNRHLHTDTVAPKWNIMWIVQLIVPKTTVLYFYWNDVQLLLFKRHLLFKLSFNELSGVGGGEVGWKYGISNEIKSTDSNSVRVFPAFTLIITTASWLWISILTWIINYIKLVVPTIHKSGLQVKFPVFKLTTAGRI